MTGVQTCALPISLTIPAALYAAAKESGVNMSQVFQDALREQLGLNG